MKSLSQRFQSICTYLFKIFRRCEQLFKLKDSVLFEGQGVTRDALYALRRRL